MIARRLAAVVSPLCLMATTQAQGSVLTVDDGPFEHGVVWRIDLQANGSIDSLELVPAPAGVSDHDLFGAGLARLGDLNGDGRPELVAGAPDEDRAGRRRGVVWVLSPDTNGELVPRHALRPGWSFASGSSQDRFGAALAPLGDLDGDGTLELAAAGSGTSAGSLWILSLAFDASVVRALEHGGAGGLGGGLENGDAFGASLAMLGDLDGDGTLELAAGAPADTDGAIGSGAVWILSLAEDGTLASHQKISATTGGFGGSILTDAFGSAVTALGDVNDDGTPDLAVGAPSDDDGDTDAGSVWILFLAPDGTVSAEQKISKLAGGLASHSDLRFGSALAPLGDLNGDGTPDLAVGAQGGTAGGALFVLFLAPDGTVSGQTRHGSAFGVVNGDELGASLAEIGDWDGDGRPDLLVGAARRDGEPLPTDFSDVASAIAAASSGDTILVRGGEYDLGPGGALIQGKSLTLQAAHPGNVHLGEGLTIAGLGSAQSAHLVGLNLVGGDGVAALTLASNAGRIWIDGCSITWSSFVQLESQPGLSISSCAAVVLNRTSVTSGLHGVTNELPASPGMQTSASRVYAYESSFGGADGLGGSCSGPPNPVTCYEPGGAGILATTVDDFLFLSGCTVQGGDGRTTPCRAGGAGLATAGRAKALDTSFAGGTGCPDGSPTSGDVEPLSGASLAMAADTPTRAGEDTLIAFAGPPGAGVFVLYSLATNPRYRPALQGAYLLGGASVLDYAGRIGPDGTLRTLEFLGLLPPGVEVLRLYAQAYYQLPASPDFPGKLSPYPRPIQLGAGTVLNRLQSGL